MWTGIRWYDLSMQMSSGFNFINRKILQISSIFFKNWPIVIFIFYICLLEICKIIIDGHECLDLDECLMSPCKMGFRCENTHGSYICYDVNECKKVHFFTHQSLFTQYRTYVIAPPKILIQNRPQNLVHIQGIYYTVYIIYSI